jgi:hypothetical protein
LVMNIIDKSGGALCASTCIPTAIHTKERDRSSRGRRGQGQGKVMRLMTLGPGETVANDSCCGDRILILGTRESVSYNHYATTLSGYFDCCCD